MSDSSSSGKPTLAFFYSPRSGPSRKVEAFLAQVLQRRRNHETFALRRINADERPDLVKRFAVAKVPALVVVEQRRVRARLEGAAGCREIEHLLEPWLRGRRATAQPAEPADDPLVSASSLYDRRGLNLPPELAFERWQSVGRKIGVVADGSLWWLADWAAYGAVYEDRQVLGLALTGLDPRTLRTYAWVAGRFPPARRREKLTFAHHAEVASLTDPEQEEWLDRAEDNGWSRNELRAELRRHSQAREPAVEEQLQLTVASDELARWRTTAEAEGLDLTDWVHSVADEAARPSESAVRAA